MPSEVNLTVIIVALALAIIIAVLGILYGITSIKLANLTGKYNELKTKYTSLKTNYTTLQGNYNNLESQYNDLQNQYTTLQNQYNQLRINYTNLLNNYKQLLNGIGAYDNTTASKINAGTYYAISSYIFVPYGYNALAIINVSCTNITNIQFGPPSSMVRLFNITGPITLKFILPPGIYTPFIWSMGDNNNMTLSTTVILLRNITKYIDIVEKEDTYTFTTTLPYWGKSVLIMVPYGYNVTLSISIVSNKPINAWVWSVSYNGSVYWYRDIASDTTSYSGVMTFTPGSPQSTFIYGIYIEPYYWQQEQNVTVSVAIRPIAITPIG